MADDGQQPIQPYISSSQYLRRILTRFLIGNLIALAIELGILAGIYVVIQSQINALK